MLGCVAATVGAYIYSQVFRAHSTVAIIRLALITIATATICSSALILHWTRQLGIADITTASFNTILGGIAHRMLAMPLTGAIMPFCSEGHEGTMYALFTSVGNVASIVGMILGSVMAEAAGMSKQHLHSLWILCVVQGLIYLAMIPFATLVPDTDAAEPPPIEGTRAELEEDTAELMHAK
jgi:MFS family permease